MNGVILTKSIELYGPWPLYALVVTLINGQLVHSFNSFIEKAVKRGSVLETLLSCKNDYLFMIVG